MYTHSIHYKSGPLAQLVEQLTFNQWVTGSNPVRLTTKQELCEYDAEPFIFRTIYCKNKSFFKHRLPILVLTNLRDKVGKNICKYCLVQEGSKDI